MCVYTHTWAIVPSWQQASRCCIKLTARPCPLAPSPAHSAPVRIRLWLRPSARSHSAQPVQAAVAAAMTIPHRLPEPRASCRRCAGPASSSYPQCIAVVREISRGFAKEDLQTHTHTHTKCKHSALASPKSSRKPRSAKITIFFFPTPLISVSSKSSIL